MSCHTPLATHGGEIRIVPELHCRFLVRDPASDQSACSVYADRRELAPWCLSAEEAAQVNALAHDCPYTQHIPGWTGKRWATPQERAALLPEIRKQILEDGLIAYDSPDSAVRLLNSREAGGCETDVWEYELSDGGSRYRFRRVAV